MVDINLTVNNNIKCKWIKQSNQKAEIARLGEKNIQLLVVYRRHTLDPKIQTGVKKWMKKIYYTNSNHKKAGVTRLISDKVDFFKNVTRDEEGHFIMSSIH